MRLDIVDKITYLRRKLYVHCAIYYRYNNSIIDDTAFDRWAYQLRDLQAEYPLESEAALFAEEFTGWDGTTGMHLPYNEWVLRTAANLLGLHRPKGDGNEH